MYGSLNLAYVMNYAFSGSFHQYDVPPFYQKSPACVILNVEMLLFSFSVSTSLLLLSLEIIRSVINTCPKSSIHASTWSVLCKSLRSLIELILSLFKSILIFIFGNDCLSSDIIRAWQGIDMWELPSKSERPLFSQIYFQASFCLPINTNKLLSLGTSNLKTSLFTIPS